MEFIDLKFDATGQMYAAFQTIEELTSAELASEVQKDIERNFEYFGNPDFIKVEQDGNYVSVRVKYFGLINIYDYSTITDDFRFHCITLNKIEKLAADFGYKLVKHNG